MSDAKWEKIGTIAYIILMVFYGVFTMVLAIQAYTKFSDTTEAYLSIVNNLSSNFITDVQISNTKCPQDYSTMFDWDWLGTDEGCDCTRSSYLSHTSVYSGSCNSTERIRGCNDIDEIPPVFFDAIKGSSNNKQLVCTKRGNVRFSDIIANQTGSCSSSQKLCGNPMKKGTVICVGASEPCPIYKIHKSSSQDLIQYPATEWREVRLDNGEYLYFDVSGKTSDSLPLSEIRFTQVGVCKIENTAKTIPNGKSDYILMNTERNGCDQSDDSFTRTNLQVKGFVDSSESIQSVRTAQLTVVIINIIVCILVSIILSIFQIYNLCGKDVPCIPGDGISEQRRIVLIKQVLTYGSKLLQLPFILWAFSLSVNKKDPLNEVANSQPSDARFNGDMATFADQLENDVYQKNLIALIILAITLFIDLIVLIKICFIKRLQKSNRDNSVDEKQNNVQQSYQDHAKQPNLEQFNTQAQPLDPQQQEIQLGFQQQQQQQQPFIQQQYQPQLSPYPQYPPPGEYQQQQPIGYVLSQPPISEMVPMQQQNIPNNYVQQPYQQQQQPQQPYLPPYDQEAQGFQQGYIQPVMMQQPQWIPQQQQQQPIINPLEEAQPLTYQQQKQY